MFHPGPRPCKLECITDFIDFINPNDRKCFLRHIYKMPSDFLFNDHLTLFHYAHLSWISAAFATSTD